MSKYEIILKGGESTVVTEYEPQRKRSGAYQSEAALEKVFISMLTEQGYEYIQIHSEPELIKNLRIQIEKLNNYKFTENEWNDFFKNKIADKKEGIVEKTRKIQIDYIQNLTREDGTTQNIKLIDKKNIHNNRLQIINQYEENRGDHKTRYDVTILVNGLPLVHIELKRRGVAIREAFNQINRYQRESFWAGSGLYEYIQIFVISNGTYTKYYSNTTRNGKVLERTVKNKSRRTSNSFEFTSYWADEKNQIIPDLVDFTKTFFAKHTILNILTKYCVFDSENTLLVMRPYQISATEKIINRIETSSYYKKAGKIEAGGYIWHTTGSGKTLTSFKTAQLATELSYIEKVLFVVDRRDLDYQTIKEYDRFEKGAANGNTSTAILTSQLENDSVKIIVTTIQKLDVFIKKNKNHPIYQKHIVIIFDECHRSQFGDMHNNIVTHFKKYHIFGFTGTPIFSINAGSGKNIILKTTEQAFGDKLHTYTIVDAIKDGNVLPFRFEYINTVTQKDKGDDKQVSAIDTEEVLNSGERIEKIVKYILEHFDKKTIRNTYYSLKGKRLNGFNSMLLVSSISVCKKYYQEFKKQIEEQHKDLTIATIYSFNPNEDEYSDGIIDDESFDTEGLDKSSRDFLEIAIDDYNKKFKTNFNTSSTSFQNYYKDLSDKIKTRQVDLVIVVNMFITGFDAPTLNTLWVDKNLKMHGLIQAFSRTNRILNSVKTYGNIICFRNLEYETEKAIALFGDKEAGGIVLLRPYNDYYYGYKDNKRKEQKGYIQLINELQERFPLGKEIIGEHNEKEFVVLFGNILKLRNILSSFDEFKDNEIIVPIDFQDYTSIYYDIHDKYKRADKTKESIMDDVIFEMELVKQVEVNIDYILKLVAKYHDGNCIDKEIRCEIDKAVKSSEQLRSKQELIELFICNINNYGDDINEGWQIFVKEQCEKDISELISEENLKPEETRKFIDNAFRDGILKTTGTEIDRLMPPVSRFEKNENRDMKKKAIIEKLINFFDKYFGVRSTDNN